MKIFLLRSALYSLGLMAGSVVARTPDVPSAFIKAVIFGVPFFLLLDYYKKQ